MATTKRITGVCSRPPSSAAETPIRYTDFPAAVGPMRRRPIQGSRKRSGRLRQGDVMHRLTPPVTVILSDFRPPALVRITSGWSRPPSSAAQPPIRYTDFPGAVGLMLRRPIQGSLKLSRRLRQGESMHRIAPPATGFLSDFRPPSVVRITSGWSRPPSSAAQPPIRYTDFPAAVGLILRRPIQGSLKISGRLRQEESMHRITPPGTHSNFQPSVVVRITTACSRPPSSAADPAIR
jgi:hypothetical protein